MPIDEDGERPPLWRTCLEFRIRPRNENRNDGGDCRNTCDAASSIREVKIQNQELEHHGIDEASDRRSRSDTADGEALLLPEPCRHD